MMHLSSVSPLVSLLHLTFLFFAPVAVETTVRGCVDGRDKDHRPLINCTSAGYRDVPSGIEPTTKVLLFPQNQFSHPSWTSFTVFTEIHEIDLSRNQIPSLTHSDAPILPSLAVLRLGFNQLRALPDHCFSRSPALTELYLQNNLISSLQDQSFSGLSKLEILDLSNNHVQTLPPRMMHPLKAIETLYLEGNKIKVLPDNWFSQKNEVPYLYLSANPWACSCSLGYLRMYLEEYDYNVYVKDGPIISADAESVYDSL
ncbi:platelet glycoprotein Ib alpha chain-like isoform X2 [Boleophthalmus pectinirostris]|uniref:platelet glycoprotein Ib alpha chain-like isoform X2 n=1 Tax=Boleophthalmus pectinirostris TaxID=150288 RepID=UPI00242CB69C|nr:platelet glycoprotein Ib alpha chain-like isoform X2 [Boleophthalmus pectinirostris]